jgi:serine/threonine protein kinase/Tfp pilus assembly protein PilF
MSRQSDDSRPLLTASAADEGAPPSLDFVAARRLKRELLADLDTGWEAGQPVRPEDLLTRWPGDAQADPDVASLLFEDYCQRRERGEQPSQQEYNERFPSQRNSLASISRRQELLRSLGGPKSGGSLLLALPSIGDEVFGFRLRRELGRGSFARVFLAEQIALAGRPVVVKVSAIDGDEPQTLAQMQHTHIVPLYSVHEDAAAGLRIVCMPYFGGASLSRVLQFLWTGDDPPTRGAQLVQALALACRYAADDSELPASKALEPQQSQDSPLTVLAGMSLVRASAWITARLAEALDHAHRRHVLHRDIKPSNVLLSADGQPMLLDFNLAQSFQGEHAQALATLGGTVAYMAPEHLRALATRDPALVRQVDHRADIYGLGMVLYEILTGRRPFDQSGSYSPMPALIEAMAVERGRHVPSLRERRQDVPWSLESIARKCLAPDPAQRYQQAEHLAEDLRRFLEDRPLKYAPELSWPERAAKWVRRHPRLAPMAAITTAAVLLFAVGGTLFTIKSAQLNAARVRAYEAEGAEARERKRDFTLCAERARCLIDTKTDLQDNLEEGAAACERALDYYGVLQNDNWHEQSDWQRLDDDERRQLAEDIREMLVLWAHARVRLAAGPDSVTVAALLAPMAPAQQPLNALAGCASLRALEATLVGSLQQHRATAVGQALALIDQAQALPGLEPSPALFEERAHYLEQRGDADGANAARRMAAHIPPASVRDHYMLAFSFARAGQLAKAVPELKKALALNPRHYWSRLTLGMCYDQLRDYELALAEFSACIALWPEFAWGHFNRAIVFQQVKRNAAALEEYTAALRCDPKLADAYINRGALYLEQEIHDPAKALPDFDAALALGRNLETVHGGRGIALERLGRYAEADAAFQQAGIADSTNSSLLLAYAFATCERLGPSAKAAFTKVLEKEPRNLNALYGYAMLLTRQSRQSEEALTVFSLALQLDPSFLAARQGRAYVLACRGEAAAACQDIDLCVKMQPSGPMLYQAACVYAILAGKAQQHLAAPLADHALVLLREAFTQGYGHSSAADDSDLESIRKDPRFTQLLKQAPSPKDQP